MACINSYFISKEKLLQEERGECLVKKSVALDVGYIQSGFFNHVLVAVIKKASDPNDTLNFAFYKNAAMLSYRDITYILRAQKTHISLEVDVGDSARLNSPITSRLAYMAIIDVLAVGVAQLKPEAQDHLYNIIISQSSLKIK